MLNIFGPNLDIPAPDMGTNEQTMAWIYEEYSKINGDEPGCVTGKPLELWGSQYRTQATGHGVALFTKFAAEASELNIFDAKIVIQGFGNVGSYCAEKLGEFGSKVMAISDSKTTIYNPEGLDVEELLEIYHDPDRGLKDYHLDCEQLKSEEIFQIDCDIFIPAAVGNVITENNAHEIKAKLIIEGANNPVNYQAQEILDQRGVIVVPDILANAGGVLVSYFEWVQNIQRYRWSKEVVIERFECEIK